MFTPLFIGGIGPMELFVVLALVVLLFGAQKLPELARGAGQATGEFHRGREEIERDLGSVTEEVETDIDTAAADIDTAADRSPPVTDAAVAADRSGEIDPA